MFDPVRIDNARFVSPSQHDESAGIADPTRISRSLVDAALVDRPQVAADLVDGLSDPQLFDLAASRDGTDALAALDNALADASPHLRDVQPQRMRVGDALDRSHYPVDAHPLGRNDASDRTNVLLFRAVSGATSGSTQTTAQIGDNRITWTNDSQGRPTHVEADLSEVFDGIDRSPAETQAQGDAADRGIDGDQGGHVIGHRFVKDQGSKNLFPQNGNFNVSAYKTLENEWADWIDSGKEVRITVDLTPKNQDRPDHVRVSYEVIDPASGKVVYDQRVTFRNQAGQTFERVPPADMQDF